MAENTTTPMADNDDERDAIREALRADDRFDDIHVLTWFGGEPLIALVKRDTAPATEHAGEGETVAVVEWLDGEYSATPATGDFAGSWSTEGVLFCESREDALETAHDILTNDE